MVLVNLNTEANTLVNRLKEYRDEFSQHYIDYQVTDIWSTRHAVNWKVIVENAIESYHVPRVHPTTFVDYMDEKYHRHTMTPTYNKYENTNPIDDNYGSLHYKLASKLIAHKINRQRFTHTLIYPNILLFYSNVYSSITFVEPTSAMSSKYTMIALHPKNISMGFLGKKIVNALGAINFMKKEIRKNKK